MRTINVNRNSRESINAAKWAIRCLGYSRKVANWVFDDIRMGDSGREFGGLLFWFTN